jgi:TatD DNase family protein
VLTDTHCHLDLEKFDADRDEVIRRAQRAGIARILIPGLTVTSSQTAVKLADSHQMLFAAVGVHPNDADSWDGRTISDLKQLAYPHPTPLLVGNRSKVVAIGEVGLDYYWNSSLREAQIDNLRHQLALASELHLPVVLHCREKGDIEQGACAEDLINILEEWVASLQSGKEDLQERPGVLHSFSGSIETAQRAIKLGFFIGVTGPVTYKNGENRRRVIASLPLEKLLIETDAPFLAPHPHRGKRNEPAFVAHIADKIAEIKSRTPQEVAAVTTKNAARLFAWEEPV